MISHIMSTYTRLPVTFMRGKGVWLWDTENTPYLDALAGIAVCNLGHAHPAVHKAICSQSEHLLHTSNLYGIANQEKLADKLNKLSGMAQSFFCNSGAEANEAAIKIARLYGHRKGIDKPAILVMKNSFHGRTMATLSATGNTKVQQGFAPLLDGFLHVPYNDISAIQSTFEAQHNIAAILLEPIQGEGGVNIPAADYLNQIRKLCDQYKILMMLDEVQTGIGRTGQFLAYQHNQILPDVCTLAKALANGVPIGVCMAHGPALDLLNAGTHGSTFGGNPLACSAALAVLQILDDENLISQAADKGDQLSSALKQRLQDNPYIVEIRNKGMMIGIQLAKPCAELVSHALGKQLLINVTNNNTIRLLPPLLINDAEIRLLVETLSSIINTFTQP